MSELSPSYRRIIAIIKAIPKGSVCTYGEVARIAGVYRGARQVAWFLSNSSKKEKLPWHRVINSKGEISLPLDGGYFNQKSLLEKEGIKFTPTGKVSLNIYLWRPSTAKVTRLLKTLPASIPKFISSL